MSVSDFSEWVRGSGGKEFIFDSDNNDWLAPYRFHICMRCHTAVVSHSSNRIAFLEGTSRLCLERVKEVHMFDDCAAIGTVIDIVCETGNDKRVSWRFLAD